MDGWLGFNGILSTQVAAISCLSHHSFVCYSDSKVLGLSLLPDGVKAGCVHLCPGGR